MNLFYIFIFFILLNACSTKEEASINQRYKFQDTYTFKLKASFSLPLDSVTSHYSECVQYFENDSLQLFAMHNQPKNSIYIYDYVSKKLKTLIALPTEGARGVGEIDGFYIHTLDSIFLPSTNTQAMYLINRKGNILQKYKYNRQSTKDVVQILFHSQTMALVDGKLYCPTPPRGNDRNTTLTEVLDLKTKKWNSYVTMPESYDKGFFGAVNFYLAKRTYNPNKKSFCFSFPIDNYVYEYDVTKQVNKQYAGSKYLQDVKPMASTKIWASFQNTYTFYRKMPSYREIFYDKYKKLYYRIAEHPISEEFINSNDILKKGMKNFSIIILDENLKKVGEYLPPKYTYTSTITPTKEGLLILNFKKSEEKDNEENAFYDLFEIVENRE